MYPGGRDQRNLRDGSYVLEMKADRSSGDVARQEDYAKVLVKKLFLKTTIR